MFGGFAKTIFGSSNDRYVRKLRKIVEKVNALEPTYHAMDDETLKSQTGVLKSRLAAGETLDDILGDAFAVVREAACTRADPGVGHVRVLPSRTRMLRGTSLP